MRNKINKTVSVSMSGKCNEDNKREKDRGC